MTNGGCPVCHRPAAPGFALCFCCGILVGQLRMPLVPVEVMTDYRVGDRLHRALRGYKDAAVGEVRISHCLALAGALGAWMADPDGRLTKRFGRWDLVVTVPSTQRPTGSPVDILVARVPALARRHRPLLVRGPDATDHLLASRRGFSVRSPADPAPVAHGRVLVVDDTLTTGARAQSAAAALRLAGIRVAGVVALGRSRGVVDAACLTRPGPQDRGEPPHRRACPAATVGATRGDGGAALG